LKYFASLQKDTLKFELSDYFVIFIIYDIYKFLGTSDDLS